MNKNLLKWFAAPVGLIASAAVVLGFSSAAFTSSQTNTGNSFATHDSVSLALKDNASADATLPLFAATGAHLNKGAGDGVLLPGNVVTNDITVNYTGKNNANVALNVTGASSGTVADDLYVTVLDGGTPIGAEQKLSALSVPTLWNVPGNATAQSHKFTISVRMANTSYEGVTLSGVGFSFTATAK